MTTREARARLKQFKGEIDWSSSYLNYSEAVQALVAGTGHIILPLSDCYVCFTCSDLPEPSYNPDTGDFTCSCGEVTPYF